ncbi:polysaccharide export protein [Amphritea opalescens]|uniref:Polysaccharide export protein n=1 Tax=Amphritea opalescens TaxID=2490544 RepID=A0A430KP77_9GAMM|nr:polysaccharide biosynthesis/export family protein [Amphritea opalescens]RTE65262.1 polysaccharide export protein [Amphritea opalescens]
MATLIFFCSVAAAETTTLSDYRLGSGDLLSIQVFGEEDLSMEIRLSDAGTIAYPFLGELKILNMTIGNLSELIQQGLAEGYLHDPQVSITVLEYRQFYINGEVKEPGGYPYQPGLTLQKAVALAGGFTERASKSKLFVSHDGETKNPSLVKLNTQIRPGDIITIEQSFF